MCGLFYLKTRFVSRNQWALKVSVLYVVWISWFLHWCSWHTRFVWCMIQRYWEVWFWCFETVLCPHVCWIFWHSKVVMTTTLSWNLRIWLRSDAASYSGKTTPLGHPNFGIEQHISDGISWLLTRFATIY